MRIIEVGSCYDNNDPKGLGRIRSHSYGKYTHEIENAIDYEKWGDLDPFLIIPFLPAHINIIPQIGQAVKLIQYDTDKDTQNTEYIAGPYGSPHDLQFQRFTTQHRDTTFGNQTVKGIADIRNTDGTLRNKSSEGAIIGFDDIGFRGNYSSDMIFTEHGVQIRGGHLVDRNKGNRTTNNDYPVMAKSMGRFSMKKFPQKKELKVVENLNTIVETGTLKYILEYEIDNIDTPTKLDLYIYSVVNKAGVNYFNTDVFGVNTDIEDANVSKFIRLISTGTTPTMSFDIDGTLIDAEVILRDILNQFNNGRIDVASLDKSYDTKLNSSFFPNYFRPTKTMRQMPVEQAKKDSFFYEIQMSKNGQTVNSYGLVFSKESFTPPPLNVKKKDKQFVDSLDKTEQSFASLSADKIYITSLTPNNVSDRSAIPFDKLNKYELTQEDYVKNIEPNTYSLVRGEVLYDFITAFKDLMVSHIHQINDPLSQNDPNFKKFIDKFDKLSNDLLNNSVRIN
jgi:hypothetical protein